MKVAVPVGDIKKTERHLEIGNIGLAMISTPNPRVSYLMRSCGPYYKHITIIMSDAYTVHSLRVVKYVPRVMLQIVVPLTDSSSGIIYDNNRFIVQANGSHRLEMSWLI